MIALAIAAAVSGTTAFSKPPTTPRPEVTVTSSGAPFMRKTPSTLPTRSTTAIVAG